MELTVLVGVDVSHSWMYYFGLKYLSVIEVKCLQNSKGMQHLPSRVVFFFIIIYFFPQKSTFLCSL